MKNQMLLFPYLERMGIIAVPRVLWGREDLAIGKIRKLLEEVENIDRNDVFQPGSLKSQRRFQN